MGFLDRFTGKSAPAMPAGVFPSLTIDDAPAAAPVETVSLVSIAKPVWAYGLEMMSNVLPTKEGPTRRIAFAQLATPGLPNFRERLDRPEDDLGRFARGLPLWLAEAMYFSSNYTPIAVLGLREESRHVLFPHPWTHANIRQIVDTATDKLDFVLTGTLLGGAGTHWELTLSLWDVAKGRERKAWALNLTPDTADRTLASFQAHFSLFLEWAAQTPGNGLAYKPVSRPMGWIQTLGISSSLFLAEKNALALDKISLAPALIDAVAQQAVTGETASLAWLTFSERARRLGLMTAVPAVQLLRTSLVKSATAAPFA